MRLHVGVGIPIKKVIEFLGFIFVALLAFFGIDKLTAHAWTTTNASGYDVHAYRPLYSNETDGTCSPSNYSGCTNQNQLYNATGCNNINKSGSTYCFFQNNNSTSYFSVKSMTCNNNSQCFAMANDTYGTNQTYRPRSMLVWKWKNTNVSWCTSGNIKLRFEMYLDSNNTVLNYTNLCAHNLNSVTSSIGICSPLIKVNNSYYNGSNISSGTNTEQYEVTIPKPTTDLEIIVDDIQPFLKETGGEGGSYSNKTWNYGFRLVSYECTDTNANQDTNAIISNDNQNTQSIINNQNNNTNNINQHIDNSATAIVDSIDDLKDIQDDNTHEIIDSQKACFDLGLNDASFFGNLTSSGNIENSNAYKVNDYLYIKNSSIKVIRTVSTSVSYCFYDKDKIKISCNTLSSQVVNSFLIIPSDAYYFRSSFRIVNDAPIYTICKNGNQAIYDSINDDSYNNNGQLGGLNDKFNEYGIDDLARAPLSLLSEIYNSSSATCSPLVLPITLGNSSANAEIPCGTGFWSMFPSSVVNLYHTLVFGLSGWFIIKKLIKLVEDSLDPDDKSDMINAL